MPSTAYGLPLTPILDRFSIPEPNSGCILWIAGLHQSGYGVVNYKGKQYRAHRAAWEMVNGPIPDGLYACHKCDVPACINPGHIFLGSQKDNLADMTAKGRRGKGTRRRLGAANNLTKLTEREVLEIRRASGSQGEIAAQYRVSRSAVGLIKQRKNWRHLAEEGAPCR